MNNLQEQFIIDIILIAWMLCAIAAVMCVSAWMLQMFDEFFNRKS